MSTETRQAKTQTLTVSRRLAAEDIRVGSYVTVILQINELVSFLWMGESCAADPEQPVLYRHTPCNSGEPFKVLAVCLPFVFVEDLGGETQTFDLRRCEITQLTNDFVDVVRRKRKKSKSPKLEKKRRQKEKKSRR